MTTLSQVRRTTYRAARGMGDVNATLSGYRQAGVTGAIIGESKRRVRRRVYRQTNGAIWRVMKQVGLS